MSAKTLERSPIRGLSDSDWRPSCTTGGLGVDVLAVIPQYRGSTLELPLGRYTIRFQHQGDVPSWLRLTVDALDHLLRLEEGWDSYGGQLIDENTVLAALQFAVKMFPDNVPIPSVVPTSKGGLQFEWHTRGVDLEVEFVSPTRVIGLFEDRQQITEWERELTNDHNSLRDALSVLSTRGESATRIP